MIRSLAHTAVCVPDLDAAIRGYESALGLEVLAPPVLMKGEAIERDMSELVPRIAGLRTTWFRDPHGTVFILMEKCTDPGKPYFRQMSLVDLRKGG